MTARRPPSLERPVSEALGGPLDEPLDETAPLGDAAHESSRLRRARVRSLVLALLLLAVAVALAIPLARSQRHPSFQGFDESWRSWVSGHRSTAATAVAKVLSVVGSVYVTLPLRLAVVAALAVRRRWLQLAAFAAAVATSEVLVGVVKVTIDRPRPPGAMIATTGASFPSGHAIAAAVTAFGIVVAFLPRGSRRWHWLVASTFFAGSMAWSRTYLSAHWATDTIAGICIGTGLALLAEVLFEGGRNVVAEAIDV